MNYDKKISTDNKHATDGDFKSCKIYFLNFEMWYIF